MENPQTLQARRPLSGALMRQAGVAYPGVQFTHLFDCRAGAEQMNLIVNQHSRTVCQGQRHEKLGPADQSVEHFMIGATHGVCQLSEQGNFRFPLALHIGRDNGGNFHRQ